MAQSLSVSWEEYEKNICKGFGALQQRGEFVDMTLAADGHHVKVHQMVMSLVSPFIKELITCTNCPHPVIFLNRVSYETMQAILEYAYSGEVVVKKEKIGEFLDACRDLRIKGLDNMLKEARSTVSNIFSEFETDKDKTPIDRYDSVIHMTHNTKRKKLKHDDIFEEIVPFDDDNDDDDMHQTDPVEEVEVESTPNWSTKEQIKQMGPIQYSVSCQGNLQIVVNRYLYAFRHLRKNDHHRFWRCISQQKTGCPAIITTFEDSIVERSFPHNHAFHDGQILKRVKNGNMFTNVVDVEGAAAAKRRKKDEADVLKKALTQVD